MNFLCVAGLIIIVETSEHSIQIFFPFWIQDTIIMVMNRSGYHI